MVTSKAPKRSTRKKKPVSSRSKKLSKMYKDEFDEMDDEMGNSFKMPASAMPGNGKKIFLFFVLGMLIGAGVALFYGQYQMDSYKEELAGKAKMNQNLSPEDKVEKLLRFKSGKKPVVQRVKDVSLIKGIPLYEFAQNGDSVIVYDGITVIYDELNNKLVSAVPQSLLKDQGAMKTDEELKDGEDPTEGEEVANDEELNSTDDGAETENEVVETKAIEAKNLEVEVRNGTKTAGLAGKKSKALTDVYDYKVTPANAEKSTYKESILVDFSNGGATAHISDIKKTLDVTKVVTELPDGEKSTTADIVIIVTN